MTNKSTIKLVMGFATFVLVALTLSGCGGGDDSSTSIPVTPVTPPAKMGEALTLPTGHGLAVGEFTIQPGASDEYGNVVVSCPAGGNACVVTVSADGTATYDRTGGVPTVMAAYQPWNLPTGHGLAVGEFTLQPGASDEYGNVVASCPAGGNACVVTVSADGTATYDRTGGVPTVMAAYQPWNLPTGHGLAVGEFTLQPGASDEYGNVVVSCPAGGNACVVTVSADGTATYDRTGGVPTVMAAYQPWNLPTGHGLAVGEFTLQPGASDEYGNVVVSCPAGGNACVVTVSADGTATYDRTGGVPSVMAAYQPWNLPTGHGLAVGEFTVQPGASDELGNVVVSCPAGGGACVVTVAADGTATYARTGGMPTVMAAYESWNLPAGHGLAVGEFTLQPGASDEYGNVVVSCPAGGGDCVVTVSADGTATYARTGGTPTVMAAYESWNLPTGHGLAVGEFTLQPGASDEHGNVVVSCPAGGNACVVTVSADGTATYARTGGVPSVMAAYQPWNLPTGHGLAVGEFTVRPGASDEYGNVVVSCPAGGGACVVTVAADGTATYDRTGGMPTVMAAYESWNLPMGHGLAVGVFTIQPGVSDEYGNVVVSCPAGGNACVVTVAVDGTATYDRTGGMPTVMAAYQPWNLPTGHGLAVGEFTLQPGASDEYGNVVLSCPAGGAACVVTVAADGTASYDRTGGVPSVMAPSERYRIATTFSTTRLDHYPLDARRVRPEGPPEKPQLRICGAGDQECQYENATALTDYAHMLENYEYELNEFEAGRGGWRMVIAKSDIASREDVWAMLQENVFRIEVENEVFQDGIFGYLQPPVVRFVESSRSRTGTIRAIDNINAWLPWDKHITVGGDIDRSAWTQRYSNFNFDDLLKTNEIGVDLDTPLEHSPRGAVAWAGWNSVHILANRGSTGTVTMQHELLHVLGLNGGRSCREMFGADCDNNSGPGGPMFYFSHVPVKQFPESEMAYASPYNNIDGLSQIDGEVIQVIYTREAFRQIASDPGRFVITPESMSFDDLGPWDDTVVRYSGSIENWPHRSDALLPAFGVDWRNGMARPWTVGSQSYNAPAELGLSGTATWTGELVGFTPAMEAVHGDSEINMDLAAMTGNAAFTALEHWDAGDPPGQRGTGTQWHDGDLHYSLALDGNYFRSNRGDEGYVSGRFVGPEHEGAVGILERPDLTGAFGAMRQ